MKSKLDPLHAVYVGSFDPMTLGHEDVILRAARIFPVLTVGVGINPDKNPLFSPEERVSMLKHALREHANVEIETFSGLTVDYLRELGAGVLVRGLRTVSDIETEFTMTLANHHLEPEIETVFLMASEQYAHISSTLIKQIARLGKGSAREQLRKFVPECVVDPLIERTRRND
jgi:pantetheine-phosphate adenylyltransferase